jgi:predicted nucleic acid-binding protein
MRILLDSNLLVRAAITPNGLARKLLRCIEEREEHILVISAHVLSEVADVLHRPRIQGALAHFGPRIRTYCRYLSNVGEEVSAQRLSPVITDPKDQAVI